MLGEAVVSVRADYQMVQHADADQLPGLAEALGQAAVLRARLGVAARVIVDEDDGGRALRDGAL